MRVVLFTVVLAVIGILLTAAHAGPDKGPDQGLDRRLIARIQSEASSDRLNAVNHAQQSYDLLTARLLGVAKGEFHVKEFDGFSDPKVLATSLLASMNYKEAAPLFVSRIDWRAEPPFRTAGDPFDGYPCAQALKKLGPACIPEILAFVRGNREISDEAIELYATLLRDQYEAIGVDKAAVGEIIRKRMRPDSRNLERLRGAVE